jgi:uncharacterized OB-fold protein
MQEHHEQNEFAPFWDAVRQRELQFPWCDACERFHWYPMKRCPFCLRSDYIWRAVDPLGHVYSWTVVRHSFDASLNDVVPYVVALVEFVAVPGVRLVTNIITENPERLAIGAAVEPDFDQYGVESGGFGTQRLVFVPGAV